MPGALGRDPAHDHLHLIVALPIDDGDAKDALAMFRRRRNANMPRSVYFRKVEQSAGGPLGLIGYWQCRKNLRIRGAKPIACRAVKTLGKTMILDLDVATVDLRDDIADAMMMGDTGRSDGPEAHLSPLAAAFLRKVT